MRKLASIQKIINIQPMEDCDNIQLATVLGWNVVIAKSDNFKVGDLVVYFEIDSMIPEYMREDLSFMKDSKWRIRTKKIKNMYSAGLILPLLKVYNMYLKNNPWIPYETEQESWYKNVFNGFFGLECGNNAIEFRQDLMFNPETLNIFEGIDLTTQLGIVKYEIPDASLNNGQTKGNFIENCPKTDETRIQNFSKSDYKKLQDIDDQWVISSKMDGSSFSGALINNEFRVCSHNLEKKSEGNCTFWEIARKLKIEEKMRIASELFCLTDWVIQAELVGPGIQSNRQGFKEKTLLPFYIFDITNQEYMEYDKFKVIMRFMELKTVPIIDENFDLKKYSIESLLNMVDGIHSKIDETKYEEGYVISAKHNHKLFRGSKFGRISFKVISNKYLLKEK